MVDDVYVKILKFAKDQPNGIFTLQTIYNEFPEQINLIQRESHNNRLFAPIQGLWTENALFSLSFEDNFRLMEHQELVEARSSARLAFKVAVISISLNVVALLYSFLNTASVRVANLDELLRTVPVVTTPAPTTASRIESPPTIPSVSKSVVVKGGGGIKK